MGFQKEWPGWLEAVCRNVDLGQVEWLSECNAGTMPCGLLVRVWQQGKDLEVDDNKHNLYSSPKDRELSAFRNSGNSTQVRQSESL